MANSYTEAVSKLNKQIAEFTHNTEGHKLEIVECEIKKINLAIFKGDFTNALQWIKEAKQNIDRNTTAEAQLLDAEGELYYRITDIEIAEQKWSESFEITRSIAGIDSIYIAQSLARMARIASYRIQIDKAFNFSLQAIQILERHTSKITEVNTGEIYREYAYAIKVSARRKDNSVSLATNRREFFKAITYAEQSLGKNNYYTGQLLHDIGNAYNDETHRYRNQPDKLVELKKYVDSANIYYNKSIEYNRLFYGTTNRISVTYFVKGLLLQSSFLKDNFSRSLSYYNQSIKELAPSFHPVSDYDNPVPDSTVFDKSAVVQSILYKGGLLDEFYHLNHDTSLLPLIHKQYIAASKWYELMLKSYQSQELNLIIGIYQQVPYPVLANTSLELYMLTNNEQYISEIYSYLELKNYYTLLTSTHDKNKLFNFDITKVVTPLPDVQQKLNNNTAILEFFDGDNVAIITHSKIEFVTSSFTQVAQLREAIIHNDFKQFKTYAYESYLSGFKSLEKHLNGIQHLIVVPNAATALLPFDALLSDTFNCNSFRDCKSKYLINQYTVHFAFSSSLWAKEQKQTSAVTLLSFAPNYEKHATLKFNQDFVNDLKKKYHGSNYQNSQATKSNFISTTNNCNGVIHLAVHGKADVENPEFSKLIFAGENDTSYFGFADISKLHLQTPLVVLGACKTQEGRNYSGEGLLNFPRAFALAGASSTVSSIWSVDDKATSLLLNYFYKNLDAGTSKSEALRKAKLSYLVNCSEDEASPLYWSGIILNGDDCAIEIRKRHQYLLWVLSAIGLAVLSVVYWNRKTNV